MSRAVGLGSFQIPQVRQPLLDDRLLLGRVFEPAAEWGACTAGSGASSRSSVPLARRAAACPRRGRGSACRAGRGSWASRRGGRRRGPAGRDARAAEGDDAFGAVGAGQVGVGLDPGRAGPELRADPVGVVGQRDQVGVALAGRVDAVGGGGGDDLREQRRAGLGVAGVGQGRRGRGAGRRRPGGGSRAAASAWRAVLFR